MAELNFIKRRPFRWKLLISIFVILVMAISAGIYQILLMNEVVTHGEFLGRTIGLDLAAQANDGHDVVIDSKKINEPKYHSDYYRFRLILRNGFKMSNKSADNKIIGFYIQTKQLPMWPWSMCEPKAMGLWEDCHIELIKMDAAVNDSELGQCIELITKLGSKQSDPGSLSIEGTLRSCHLYIVDRKHSSTIAVMSVQAMVSRAPIIAAFRDQGDFTTRRVPICQAISYAQASNIIL